MKKFGIFFAAFFAVIFASCSGDSGDENGSSGSGVYSVESENVRAVAEENGIKFTITRPSDEAFDNGYDCIFIYLLENGRRTTVTSVDYTLEENNKIEVLYPLVKKGTDYIFRIQLQTKSGTDYNEELSAITAKGGIGHVEYPDLTNSVCTATYGNSVEFSVDSESLIDKTKMRNIKTVVNCFYNGGKTRGGWFYYVTREGIQKTVTLTAEEKSAFDEVFKSNGADTFRAEYSYFFDLPAGTESYGVSDWRTATLFSEYVTVDSTD
jgi:hypothetical protein